MARQPLSQFTRKKQSQIEINLNAQALTARPELALIVLEIIAGWTKVEVRLSELFACYSCAYCTRGRADVAMAVYNSVDNFRVQKDMINAAAEEALDVDKYKLYDATMKFIEGSRRVRNEMAHSLWGITDLLPDALIIIDTKPFQRAHTLRTSAKHPQDVFKAMRLAKVTDDGVFVYRKPDLENHLRQTHRAEYVASCLRFLVEPSPVDEERGVKKLLEEPQIAQAVRSI